MADSLADLLPDVEKLFGVRPSIEEPGEVISMTYALGSLADPTNLFAAILGQLCLLSPLSDSGFASGMRTLQEELELGMRYDADKRSLHEGEKVVGRTIVELLAGLSSAQHDFLCRWQDLAIKKARSDPSRFDDEDVQIMVSVRAWLRSAAKRS